MLAGKTFMALSVQSKTGNKVGSFSMGGGGSSRVSVNVPKRKHSQLYEDKISRVESMHHIPFTVCHKK